MTQQKKEPARAELVRTVDELTKIIEPDKENQIDSKKAKAPELRDWIEEASEVLEPEDDLSENATKTIQALGLKTPKEEEEKEEPGSKPESEGTKDQKSPKVSNGNPAPKKESKSEQDEKPVNEKKEQDKKIDTKQSKKSGNNPEVKKKPGIIAIIAESIENAGKEGISKSEILEVLKSKFPDREEKSMKNTISVQVPNQISKKRFEVEKLESGKYHKK